MTRIVPACCLISLCIAAAPAGADEILPSGRITNGNDIQFGILKLGKREAGKTIITPDTLRILAPESTGDLSEAWTKTANGRIARTLAQRATDVVRPEDYRDPSDPDDTLAFKRASATGRLISLTDGKTYTVCEAIPVKRGVVGPGATVKPCVSGFPVPYEDVLLETTKTTAGIPINAVNSIFHNTNWTASTFVDDGLIFQGFIVDLRGTSLEEHGAFHIIKARKARNVIVDGITTYGGGDMTAFQATDGTIVRNSRAYHFRNAGADHWEGASNALVENNEFVCSERYPRSDLGPGVKIGPDGAVMFTAASSKLASANGRNLVSRGNRISGGCNAGVFVNILALNSSLTNVVSEGDIIDASLGENAMGAVVFEGNVIGGRISNTIAKNGNGPASILLRPDVIDTDQGKRSSGVPYKVQVNAPQVVNWTTDPGNYSPITLRGQKHVLTEAMLVGGSNGTSVTVDDATTTISGTFNPAASAFGIANCLSGCVNPGTVTSNGATKIAIGVGSTQWFPTVSCFSGSLGTNEPPTARFSQNGKQITARISHEITSLGSCANGILYTLPSRPAYDAAGFGRSRSPGSTLSVLAAQSSGALIVQDTSGNTPATTSGYDVTVTYEVQ
ncbi:hypothetical protein PUR23_21260 [Methylorubrum populi]|uniref:hypothetical protein n=1 Tax=Methylorubrum populi TaxID=223967 RepID=UPI0031F92642